MLIGASLKMYFSHARTLGWLEQVAQCAEHPAVRSGRASLFAIPQFPSIPACVELAAGRVAIGAQDVAEAEVGAYTGEVSAAVLAEVGCTLVEIGHAERRALYGETDAVVARKTASAFRHGLTPVLCVGERDHQPPAEAAAAVIDQVEAGLAEVRSTGTPGRLIVAYEPIWAIGAAEPADPDHITGVCRVLRTHLAGDTQLDEASVIYGGSAGPGLLPRIASDVDGMFLGRFAHEASAVSAILDEVDTIGR